MTKLPIADNTDGLPYGGMGRYSIVCKSRVENRPEDVALKVSKQTGHEIERYWKRELDKSQEISGIIPTAAYHEMVELRDQGQFPTFAMEIVSGYPIIDINMDCVRIAVSGRIKGWLPETAPDQLREHLETVAKQGWQTADLQYFF